MNDVNISTEYYINFEYNKICNRINVLRLRDGPAAISFCAYHNNSIIV